MTRAWSTFQVRRWHLVLRDVLRRDRRRCHNCHGTAVTAVSTEGIVPAPMEPDRLIASCQVCADGEPKWWR